MTIRRYESKLLSSNMYLIVENGHSIVIDPYEDVSEADGVCVDYILLTHEHFDHISGVNNWRQETKAPVLCSKACAERIKDPKSNMARYFNEFCELQTWIELDSVPLSDPDYSCTADLVFEDEAHLEWQGHVLNLFEMPGHSMGSIGILLDDSFFFSGDSLFENKDIELRLPGGSKRIWQEFGLPRLSNLPDNVMVFPGHFGEFRYRKERREPSAFPL